VTAFEGRQHCDPAAFTAAALENICAELLLLLQGAHLQSFGWWLGKTVSCENADAPTSSVPIHTNRFAGIREACL
jgi:hypothetical protein